MVRFFEYFEPWKYIMHRSNVKSFWLETLPPLSARAKEAKRFGVGERSHSDRSPTPTVFRFPWQGEGEE